MDKEDIVTQVNLTKLLELVDEDAERYNNQYNRLLKQNRSLQKEVKDLKSQLEQYTKIQIESDYCELSKSCKLLQKYVTENDNLRKIMWESRCPHVVMGECSQKHHDNCHGMAKCIEDLQAENEIQKKELCQRYEEPEFATFLLMGKTAKEWQNIQAENEELKNDILNGVMCITCPDKNENCRLQAENERLKEENEELKTLKDMYFTYYKAKHDDIKGEFFAIKKENERLKEENNELCKRMAEVTYRATGGRLSYPNYTLDAIEQAFYDQLEILSDQKSEEYKQTLQEIREYCEQQNLKADYTACEVLDLITIAEGEGKNGI